MMYKFLNCLLLCLCVPVSGMADVQVKDDKGRLVSLEKPARRIVSLAPHQTEMLFAAGAGEYIIATVAYSDYPEQAKKIPRIGSYVSVDLEAIVSLKPDLVIAWLGSNNQQQVNKLVSLGIPVFIDEPRHINDIPGIIERFAILAGTTEQANKHNKLFREKLARLKKKYAKRKPVRLFYQFWNQPMMTLSGQHIVGEVMRLCGAENIFHDTFGESPKVDIEAVLAADPEVIIAAGMNGVEKQWLADWQQWKSVKAVKNQHLYAVDPDHLHRTGPRILLGAEALCQAVDRARH